MIRIFLCSAIFLFYGCIASMKDVKYGLDGETIRVYEIIKVKYDTGEWHLFLGKLDDAEFTLPIQAMVKVYASKGNQIIRITSPEDMNKLDGFKISSKKEALDFVRLFTNEELFVLFDSPKILEKDPEKTTVEKINNGYMITRMLYHPYERMKNNDLYGFRSLYKFQEKVTFDGRYTIIDKQFIEYIDTDHILIPFIE